MNDELYEDYRHWLGLKATFGWLRSILLREYPMPDSSDPAEVELWRRAVRSVARKLWEHEVEAGVHADRVRALLGARFSRPSEPQDPNAN